MTPTSQLVDPSTSKLLDSSTSKLLDFSTSQLTADQLRDAYLKFFESKGHTIISGASLIPENDPTVLFTTAGMHPLVPYLLGEKHPAGSRLTDVQKCVRTGDIDAVGDSCHLTFFEMLGNWSLGDYFKKEAIEWSYEFLTRHLGFAPEQLSVTVFQGEGDIPRDDESAAIWKSLGIPEERIHALPKEDNWWGPAGTTGPCGPDTEMFIDTGKPACGAACRPGCRCGKHVEIWNDVFMQYNKTAEGAYEPLKQHNVDTGMGVERTICMMNGCPTVYETELFAPLMAKIRKLSTTRPADAETAVRAERIIADHMRTSVFILGDPKGGVKPGNIGANYVLRRLIRRSVRYAKMLGIPTGYTRALAEVVIEKYKGPYPELEANRDTVIRELGAEEERFEKTLNAGQREFDKVAAALTQHGPTTLSGRTAFKLYDTYGFPLEFTEELAAEQGLAVDRAGYEEAFKKHQEASKQGDATFKGGLADNTVVTTRLHTATHLLHKALQMVLGPHALQKGSNITPERLRFDFSHPDKMTREQIEQVEALVNEQIQRGLPITVETMAFEDAKGRGAIALFSAKYEEQVKVYTVGDFSMEVCGGPHAANTGELGGFKIQKEESSSAGVRRIKAVITNVA
ncbi:MAG: alanine--tRNA ligase [Kiritimatiellaeota bacterium]|nr:alanine--tRNA ligase [Kiritimatiellota bacterium]